MNSRRAALALVLALLASTGMVLIVMGLTVGARMINGDGSAVGYAVSAAVHLLVGGSFVVAAFAALRRINRGNPPS